MQPTAEDYAFVARYTPMPMAGKVASLRRRSKAQAIGVLISAAIALAIWYFTKDQIGGWRWLLIFSVAFSILLLITTLLRLWRCNRLLGKIPKDAALRIDPLGLVLSDQKGVKRVNWDQVSKIRAKARPIMPGPDLVVEQQDGSSWKVPFLYLDVMPGSIDSAIRAHNQGRRTLDLTSMSKIISAY